MMLWKVVELSLRLDKRGMVFCYVELGSPAGESTTFNSKSYKNPGSAFKAARDWALLLGKNLEKEAVTVCHSNISVEAMESRGLNVVFHTGTEEKGGGGL